MTEGSTPMLTDRSASERMTADDGRAPPLPRADVDEPEAT
jgi:hypothetical protein